MQCGAAVSGSGYTNHCPACLWSQHVDVNPGDRQAACGGLMRPLGVESGRKGYRIRHRCEACGFERVNTTAENDDFEAILRLARNATPEPDA